MAASLFRVLCCVLVTLRSLLALPALAVDGSLPVVRPAAPTGGLQISLNTNVYRVYAGDTALRTRTGEVVARPGREVLSASVNLINRSGDDLAFTFPTGITTPQQRFQFRVFNAAGEQVWSSADVSDPTDSTVTALLRKRSKWSANVQIHLKPEGAWLPVGLYTLEASLAGTPTVGATTLFEISEPPSLPQPVPPKHTGIKGQVLRAAGTYMTSDGDFMVLHVMPHGIRAKVAIEEIVQPSPNIRLKAPFVWRGETSMDGHFQAATPPGRFRVTVDALDQDVLDADNVSNDVSRPPELIPSVPPQKRYIVEATVAMGAYSTLNLTMDGGITFQQPRTDTGIKGQFFLSTPSTESQVRVAAGASVIVTELRNGSPGTLFLRPAFSWSGVADSEGRFHVNTPPGSYRITVRWSKPAPPPGTATLPYMDWDSIPMRGEFNATVVKHNFAQISGSLSADLIASAQMIHSIEGLELRSLSTNASLSLPVTGLVVVAHGRASSAGWSHPELRKRGVTEDGIVEYDFVALPPSGIVAQVLTSIGAIASVEQPANFRGVRIYSATNHVQTLRPIVVSTSE